MKRNVILTVITIFIFSLSSYGSQDELFLSRGKASQGAQFINSQFDPYGVSTGTSLVSYVDTVESIFANPAGLCMIDSAKLALSGTQLSFDRYVSYLSFAKPVGKNQDKALGFTLLSSYVGGITTYDEADDIKGSDINYMGNSFIFTYSKPISMVKFGINVKVLNELIDKSAAYGGAFDIGFLVTPPLPVQVGITVKNLPGIIKWSEEKKVNYVDNSLQFAIGYKSFNGGTKIGLSFLKESGDENIYINVGGEFEISSFLAIRFGFLKGNFTGGVGINLSFARINYAFYNDEFLDASNGSNFLSIVFNL